MKKCTAVFLLLALSACGNNEQPAGPTADLVLINGNVVTVDADRPSAEALAVIGDRIHTVGSNAEIQALIAELRAGVGPEYQVTLMGGVPTYWRTLNNDSQSDPAWADGFYGKPSDVHVGLDRHAELWSVMGL